jgi:NADPH-dependent 2,4-dienoyl-CoA reductase/sulfur reductase-like enzyme
MRISFPAASTSSSERGRAITIFVDGQPVIAYEGETVAAVLLAETRRTFRRTPGRNEPRGLFCGIGVCYDCLVTVNGQANVRAGQTPGVEGMRGTTEKTQRQWRQPASSARAERGGQADLYVEAAVVGAGPAGLEAAIATAGAGVRVALLDSASQLGGQYFKGPDWQPVPQQDAEAAALFSRVRDIPTLQHFVKTQVWGAFPEDDGWLLTLDGPSAPFRIHTQTLILATGAYDRPIAFPGWTLPGVMTAGAAQTLLKSQNILPGKRVVVAGAGPLHWVVAAQLVRAGAEVVAVLEAVPRARFLHPKHIPALWRQWQRLREGWEAWRALRRADVTMRFGWGVLRAHGHEQVEAVTITPLDEQWTPQPGRAETVPADTVVIGYGFLPANQLTRLLGCEHEYAPRRGGWIPRRDAWMQTSLPGLFAVGDGAGVGGAALARIEGALAGLYAAHLLGRLSKEDLHRAETSLRRRLRREQRFATMLGDLFTPGPGLYTLADETTIICRCEEVRLGDIQRARAAGAETLNEIKGLTRAGMGNCQGRICGDLMAHALVSGDAAAQEQQLRDLGMLSVRPPIHPLTVETLAEAAEDK